MPLTVSLAVASEEARAVPLAVPLAVSLAVSLVSLSTEEASNVPL